jgi:hypothetical protein
VDIDDEGGTEAITLAPVAALEIIECSWHALAHNEYGNADAVDKRYAARVIAADLEDSDFRIVPAKFVATADALHAELLRQIEPLMTSTVNPEIDTLRRLAGIVDAYEDQREPMRAAN